jgi:hypothetical protein
VSFTYVLTFYISLMFYFFLCYLSIPWLRVIVSTFVLLTINAHTFYPTSVCHDPYVCIFNFNTSVLALFFFLYWFMLSLGYGPHSLCVILCSYFMLTPVILGFLFVYVWFTTCHYYVFNFVNFTFYVFRFLFFCLFLNSCLHTLTDVNVAL